LTLEAVHAPLERQEMGRMEQFESTQALLHAEREVLSKLPTWPWRPETLRGFLSAIAAPIFLLIAQLALERLLR
jgi:hypothetical protein